MKFSLTKNDKSTIIDELILSLIIILFIGMGIVIYIFRPSFGYIKESATMLLGVIMIVAGVMYIPGLIYRFATNDKKEKNKK